MSDPLHPAVEVTELFDPDVKAPPRNGQHLLLINAGGVLITGPWFDGCLAWGYKPRIPTSVKAKLSVGSLTRPTRPNP